MAERTHQMSIDRYNMQHISQHGRANELDVNRYRPIEHATHVTTWHNEHIRCQHPGHIDRTCNAYHNMAERTHQMSIDRPR